MKQWVVRIVTHAGMSRGTFDRLVEDTPLLESLRHAHIAVVHRQEDGAACFDLLPPRSVSLSASKQWAEGESERMRQFLINAVAAPSWQRPDGEAKEPPGFLHEVVPQSTKHRIVAPDGTASSWAPRDVRLTLAWNGSLYGAFPLSDGELSQGVYRLVQVSA